MRKRLYHIIFICLAAGFASCHTETSKPESETPAEDTYTEISEENLKETSTEIKKLDTQWPEEWRAGIIVSKEAVENYGLENCFISDTISDKVFKRINGISYREDCPVKRGKLRHIRLIHHDNDGNIRLGEIICNEKIADDIKEVFKIFYESGYKVESVRLIDEFDGDDEASMRANNTSCFNFRKKTTGSNLSKHAYGMAIDINPLYNPYIKKKTGKIQPLEGKPYLDRSKEFPYKIDSKDLAYKEFTKRGYKWGGSWRFTKDYQHFEK